MLKTISNSKRNAQKSFCRGTVVLSYHQNQKKIPRDLANAESSYGIWGLHFCKNQNFSTSPFRDFAILSFWLFSATSSFANLSFFVQILHVRCLFPCFWGCWFQICNQFSWKSIFSHASAHNACGMRNSNSVFKIWLINPIQPVHKYFFCY